MPMIKDKYQAKLHHDSWESIDLRKPIVKNSCMHIGYTQKNVIEIISGCNKLDYWDKSTGQ